MSKKQYVRIIILLLPFAGAVFYWYSWRPTQIRKDCAKRAEWWANIPAGNPNVLDDGTEVQKKWNLDYDSIYNPCIKKSGLSN